VKVKLIIFGSSYHAKVVLAEIEKFKKYSVIGYVDTLEVKKIIKFRNKLIKKIHISHINKFKNIKGVFGIGENQTRFKIFNQIKKINNNFKFEKIISKDTIISKRAYIGNGTFIAPGCIINHNTTIGENCLINTGSIVEHDSEIEDYCSLGPGVTTGGNIKMKKFSYIGIASVLKHNIKIGENTVVGANSYVNKNCLDNKIYFGNPAKYQRKRKKKESQFGR